jgi:predicted RNase H-like nuclease
MKTVFIGFDSAWAGNKKAPGAICSLSYDGDKFFDFHEPRLVGFHKAKQFVGSVSRGRRLAIVAIDQPTIVPNETGMRDAEKVAASVISWIGGGVQPANRARTKMFGDGAPVWKFLRNTRVKENPEKSRSAKRGRFIMEVFPALALPAFNPKFYGRHKAPKYNPANRKKFRKDDWNAVVATVVREALSTGSKSFISWCQKLSRIAKPRKHHQDELDAAICLLIAIRWQNGKRKESVMIGDLKNGYIVAPTNPEVRARLRGKAAAYQVRLDGVIPDVLA